LVNFEEFTFYRASYMPIIAEKMDLLNNRILSVKCS